MPSAKIYQFKEADAYFVNKEELITKNACLFKVFNMYTVTVEELDFTSDFKFTISGQPGNEETPTGEATSGLMMSTLVSWFDVEFNLPETRVVMSTAPVNESDINSKTHWR